VELKLARILDHIALLAVGFGLGLIFAAMSVSCAHAQQQQQTPSEQALGVKLMQEIQGGLNCSAGLIAVQKQLDAANAKIKELESKPDAKRE
jgi:hypothetical protein